MKKIQIKRLCLEPEEMTEHQRTDICLNMMNFPFMTLTQSKEGAYYHDEFDEIFDLTANGFKMIKNGSKQSLIEINLLHK